MRKSVYSVFILAAFIALTMHTIAYGEEETVNVPFPGPYMLDCSFSTGEFLIFNCIWRSDRIPDDVKEALLDIEAVEDLIGKDEVEASKAKIIISWLSPPDPELIIEAEAPRKTVRDILIEKLDPGVRELVDKIQQCRYGYDGWEAIQQQSEYEVPTQFIRTVDDYSKEVIVGILNKAYEACRIQLDYPLSSSYKEFIDADNLGLDRFKREPTQFFNQTTNFTRGIEDYKPLDAMDFFKAEQKATDWLRDEAPFIDPTLGCMPKDAPKCQNRGNPEPIIKDLNSYNQYINFRAGQIQTPQDYADTIAAAREAQCTVHYPIYKHKLGTERLPEWLEHCESIEDEFDRTGIACYKGKDRILCTELRKLQNEN